jgi:NO-binding membrane sensor protein with MHYT domain
MIVGHYNFTLVALSVAIAIIASYTALDLANRVSENFGNPRKAWIWLTAGALAMGAGIWAMHFIGMLAFSLPIPMAYNWPITILSLVIAVGVSALALHILRTPTVRLPILVTGATLMGLGISAMHYTGMMAMQMFPPIHYDAVLFITSVLIAILASVAAPPSWASRSPACTTPAWRPPSSRLAVSALLRDPRGSAARPWR